MPSKDKTSLKKKHADIGLSKSKEVWRYLALTH